MAIQVQVWTNSEVSRELHRFDAYVLDRVARPERREGREDPLILSTPFEDSGRATRTSLALSRHPGWLLALQHGLKHVPYCLEAREGEKTRGLLPLAYVRSLLFGRFLVSLPYLNTGGVLTHDPAVGTLLIDRAVQLADELKVRYLELRHEQPIDHPALNAPPKSYGTTCHPKFAIKFAKRKRLT